MTISPKDLNVILESEINSNENNIWLITIRANVYDGKYYDYRSTNFWIPKEFAENKKGVINWVNDNKETVYNLLKKYKTKSGKNYIYQTPDIEHNVFLNKLTEDYVSESKVNSDNIVDVFEKKLEKPKITLMN